MTGGRLIRWLAVAAWWPARPRGTADQPGRHPRAGGGRGWLAAGGAGYGWRGGAGGRGARGAGGGWRGCAGGAGVRVARVCGWPAAAAGAAGGDRWPGDR